EALVRSFLGLPENYSLGLALRESSLYESPYFSPVALLSEAEAAGGLDAFEAQLLQELLAAPSAEHSFHSELLKGAASFIATGLAKGVLSWAGGQGAGWVAQSAGFPTQGASAADIAALQQGLANLQSSIDALSNQVTQLTQLVQSTATQTQYNTIVVPALAL